ncbi:MAG: hypothetical protein Q606_CBAC00349G0001, partial [Intestinibacter bartlettii DORA_8_9]
MFLSIAQTNLDRFFASKRKKNAEIINNIKVMRAGIQLSTSSKRAATRPKYKYFWFLYPSIESIVLAVLYRIAPIGPPRIKKNNGAIIQKN